jgi:tetratricopeptide (TPR) repeat protein
MSYNLTYEAIKLLARARYELSAGNSDYAVELLNQILILGEAHPGLKHEYPYRYAHAELFRIYESLGQDQAAFKHYKKAVQLGLRPDEIERSV